MIELHVHLEGAVPVEAMAKVYRRHGNEALGTPEQVLRFIRFEGFAEFLTKFKDFLMWLRTPEDYAFITEAALRNLSADGVRYVEFTVSLGAASFFHGLDPVDVLEAIQRGYSAARQDTGIEMRVLVDLIRNLGPDAGWNAVRLAARCQDLGVVGINLGGDEANFPADPYADIYAFARDQGLGLTAHAGEAAGPESVWACLDKLKVDRIGHAVRAAEDPTLLASIAERGVVIEACPTSNVQTGAVSRIEAHPLPRFLEAGCRVCINTDDPTFFGCRLSQELALVPDPAEALKVAIEAAFADEATKSRMLAAYNEA